jgi:hypothetical protein
VCSALLQVCARSSLALLSRLFLTLNRICYDTEMERQSTSSAGAAADKSAAAAASTSATASASASTSLAPAAVAHHSRSASLPSALASLPPSAGGSAALDHIHKHIHKSPLSPQSARSVLNSLIESSYAPTGGLAAAASAQPTSIRSAPNSPQTDLTPAIGRSASLTASAVSSPVAPGAAAAGGVVIGEGTLSMSTPTSPVPPPRSGGSIVTSPEAPGGPPVSGRFSGVGSGSMSEPGPQLTHSMSMSAAGPGGGVGGPLAPLPPDGVSAAAFAAAVNSPSGAAPPPPAASSGASSMSMAGSGVLVPSNRLSTVLSPTESGPGGRLSTSMSAPPPRLDEKSAGSGVPQAAIPLARTPSTGMAASSEAANALSAASGGVSMSVARNGLGFLLMSQFDLFDFVFFPASKVTAPSVLIPYLNEYLRTIYRHFLKTGTNARDCDSRAALYDLTRSSD